jgi:hypothetical protein
MVRNIYGALIAALLGLTTALAAGMADRMKQFKRLGPKSPVAAHTLIAPLDKVSPHAKTA